MDVTGLEEKTIDGLRLSFTIRARQDYNYLQRAQRNYNTEQRFWFDGMLCKMRECRLPKIYTQLSQSESLQLRAPGLSLLPTDSRRQKARDYVVIDVSRLILV
jgi:hypothetical protein